MPNKKDQSAVTHDDLANAIRFLSIDAVEKAKSGHQVYQWVWQM